MGYWGLLEKGQQSPLPGLVYKWPTLTGPKRVWVGTFCPDPFPVHLKSCDFGVPYSYRFSPKGFSFVSRKWSSPSRLTGLLDTAVFMDGHGSRRCPENELRVILRHFVLHNSLGEVSSPLTPNFSVSGYPSRLITVYQCLTNVTRSVGDSRCLCSYLQQENGLLESNLPSIWASWFVEWYFIFP